MLLASTNPLHNPHHLAKCGLQETVPANALIQLALRTFSRGLYISAAIGYQVRNHVWNRGTNPQSLTPALLQAAANHTHQSTSCKHNLEPEIRKEQLFSKCEATKTRNRSCVPCYLPHIENSKQSFPVHFGVPTLASTFV